MNTNRKYGGGGLMIGAFFAPFRQCQPLGPFQNIKYSIYQEVKKCNFKIFMTNI